MIIVPDKFTYVFTPRTGSRATERAFLDHVPGAYRPSNYHHDHPDDLPQGLPVYATIRNPYDQVLSWYAPWEKQGFTVVEFLHRSPPGRRWIQKRLNVYDEYVDAYFIYEDGIEQIFKTLGYGIVSVPKVGTSGVDKTRLTQEARELIDEIFEYDVKLYERITQSFQQQVQSR
jgi:hypothetical protein